MNEDKAARYHRQRRRAALFQTALAATFLVLLLATGWSSALRDRAMAVWPSPVLMVVMYVGLLAILSEAIQLPLAFYRGVILERRYELSTQTAGRWWCDHAKAIVVTLPLTMLAAIAVWLLLRWSPDYWWLFASAGGACLLVLSARLAPVMLLPLFDRCEPLQRPALVDRLVALAERAGTRVLGVFEWRVSGRTRKANAALAGVGGTRRILLSDTLLAAHSDDEVEVILAHEIGHHVHHDIWKAIALDTGLLLVGFLVADWALDASVGHFGLMGKSDVAGLPLLVLTLGAVAVGLLPLTNAVSRAHERRADRYALDLTGNVEAFASAIRRLAAQNLAEERPSRLAEIVFASHPTIADRLDAAQAWDAGRSR